MAKQDDYARYTIRVPRDLYTQLEKAAAVAGRSVNAEIVLRIEGSFDTSTEEDILREIQELRRDFERINTSTFIEMVAKSMKRIEKKRGNDNEDYPEEIDENEE